MSIALVKNGTEALKSFSVNDFKFEPIDKFDSNNPEFEVTHSRQLKGFTVWRKMRVGEEVPTWRLAQFYIPLRKIHLSRGCCRRCSATFNKGSTSGKLIC
jgi:hypothetical protein